MVIPKGAFRGERINELKAGCRTECHRHCHCAIQLQDRRWREPGKVRVELCDAWPIGFFRSDCSCVAGGYLSLQHVRTWRSAQVFPARECRETTTDKELVPVRAVLLE